MNKVNFPMVVDKARKVVESCKTKDHKKTAKKYLKSVQRTLYKKNKDSDGRWPINFLKRHEIKHYNILIKYEIENYMNELYRRVR